MPTPYAGIPAAASAARAGLTINEPASGDAGVAVTFTPSLEALANKVAQLDAIAAILAAETFHVYNAALEPALNSGWTQGSPVGGYFSTSEGTVTYAGQILCTSGAAVAGWAGTNTAFRPAVQRTVPVLYESGGIFSTRVMTISTSGLLTISGTFSVGDIIHLDGVSYRL